MRFYIVLIVAFAIGISVNANITEKRGPLVGFEGCRNDVAAITNKFTYMTKIINDAPDYKPIRQMLKPIVSQDVMSKMVTSANKNCCEKFTSNVNGEDTDAIVAFLSPVVDEYVSLVSAFVNKKPIIEKNKQALISTKFFLSNSLNDPFNQLFSCLTTKPPANRTPAEKALFDKPNKAYSDAKVAYVL